VAGFVAHLTARYRRPVARHPQPSNDPADPTDSTGPTDPADPVADDPLASPKVRLAVLGGLAIIAVLGCLLLAFDLNNQGQWGCRSVPVDDPATVAPSARQAVDRFLATGAAPSDGWAASEPNRYARSQDGTQMILDLNQTDATTFTVVRFDTCGPGIAPP
jgi:hypothetical protein